ncbi:MAG: CotH kinase family protein [Bacteroidales bacterium]|nr:CotH kinase family protein [Bacteroidales bacterium]MDZ4204151.1 CotH kinase family protein [Bacteroidales bacterium]
MKKFFLPALLVLTFVTSALKSQPSFPVPGQVYISSVVPRIDIIIHPDSLAWIYANVESDREFRATFIFNNGTLHDTIHDIGFRLRGNTSRYAQKKSFKVSFNTFISGRKYYGLEKLNLNGEHNDPSVIRARIVWDIFNQSRVPVPRSNHVRVYINNNYYGVYINVEHIDENFVKLRYGNNDGDLYKCLWPADLAYLGSNPDLYKIMSGGRRVYELKIQENDNYTSIANFINVLNNTPISQLPCALEKVFNVQDYLKIAAIDILTSNWDGYIFNKNNFYLYQNTSTGLFEYIPYDVDNTFGIDWFNIIWSNRNIYNWFNTATGEQRPLFTRLMQVPEYKAQFTYYLKKAISQVTATQLLIDSINTIRNMITPFVATDPYYPRGYGYNINSFNNSYTQAIGAHVPIGLFPYISARNTSALAQAITANAAPMIKYISHNSPRPGQQIIVTAFIEDEDPAPVAMIEYKVNIGTWIVATMHDDGVHGDGAPNDKTFGFMLEGLAANTLFEFRVRYNDSNNNMSLKPCDPVSWLITHPSGIQLFINEFMASNSNVLADEYGEYDDWIEIYNAGSASIWLGDKYLSDNLNIPTKWAFPDTTIAAGGFLLVWADGQPTQGPMHTTYKLDKEGEKIGLFNNTQSGYALIDSYIYGPQTTNVSEERVEDGATNWIFFTSPTPNKSNHLTGTGETFGPKKNIHFWPNPIVNGKIYFNEPLTFSILDLAGKTIKCFTEVSEADIPTLNPGVYFLRTPHGSTAKVLICCN